jgi:hypothetical protein
MLARPVDFLDAIAGLGFRLTQDRASRGVQVFSLAPNPYLVYWLHVYDDGSVLLTWEFAITDFLLERGIQLGSSETLNTFMFPVQDLRGGHDAAWVSSAIDGIEAQLASLDFLHPR